MTEIEADAGVELCLLDVTRAELQVEGGPGGMAVLEHLLTDREAAEDPEAVWPLIVAAFTFGPSDKDVILLERLGAVAARAGGPVLAAADPVLVGCRSFAETPDPRDWKALDAATARRSHRSTLAPTPRERCRALDRPRDASDPPASPLRQARGPCRGLRLRGDSSRP